MIQILVLCTGNSARSILGEVLLNALGSGRISAFSAGSQPAGRVNPGALRKLEREGHVTDGLSSKSWDVFTGPTAPGFDLVITVCDNAAGESCPIWNGSPLTVHWGIPDPASASDGELDAAFDVAYARLRRRIEALVQLPLESLDSESAREALDAIHALAEAREDNEH
ncbi:MAG: arsenate reductase ArsC [Pseudomonadota bacterium]